MIQNIVQYLNLRLETLGRIADLHGISERRKRESDGANVPYCYVGSGEFKAVNIDNGNVGWWRPRSGFTMEPVEVIGRAVRQQRATYPLRFVAILRRELSTSDDAFMPSRLAEDIANALNFDNGDLRGILKAINVEARASGGEFDAATIWPTEFQTSIPDLRYELAMVAVDVTVEVVGRYSCWEGECATDTDILHLFNFCDPSVVARLTPAQVECLQVIAEDANWELYNTDGTLLSTGSIPSGDTDQIVAPDATVLINTIQFDTVASGDAIDVPVVNGGSNPVGSEQSGEWVIGNSTVTINGTQVGDIVAEDSLPIAVELDGNPSGTWNAGTQTWEVTSAPCADLTVALSDNQPQIGDTITITATPTGFAPTSYQFLLLDGSVTLLAQQVGNAYNWTVNVPAGSYDVYVLATDGVVNQFDFSSITIQGDPDAAAFIVAAGITNVTQINAINQLVFDLKSYSLWTKMTAVYPVVGGTATTHKFNLKNPADTNAAYRMLFFGGIVHSATGMLPNGVNGYAETYLANNTLPQNDIHIAFYSRTNSAAADRVIIGSHSGAAQGTFIYPRSAAGQIFSRVNNSASVGVANANSQGFYIATKKPSTPNSIEVYRNNVAFTNAAAPATNHLANTFKLFVFGNYFGDYSNHECAFASIGSGLTTADVANYTSIVQAFQTTLGRQV